MSVCAEGVVQVMDADDDGSGEYEKEDGNKFFFDVAGVLS